MRSRATRSARESNWAESASSPISQAAAMPYSINSGSSRCCAASSTSRISPIAPPGSPDTSLPIPMTARLMIRLASSPGSGKLRARSPAAVTQAALPESPPAFAASPHQHVGGPGIDVCRASRAASIRRRCASASEPVRRMMTPAAAQPARLPWLVDKLLRALDQRQRVGCASGVPGPRLQRRARSPRACLRASLAARASARPARRRCPRARARSSLFLEIRRDLPVGLTRRGSRVRHARRPMSAGAGPLRARGARAGAGAIAAWRAASSPPRRAHERCSKTTRIDRSARGSRARRPSGRPRSHPQPARTPEQGEIGCGSSAARSSSERVRSPRHRTRSEKAAWTPAASGRGSGSGSQPPSTAGSSVAASSVRARGIAARRGHEMGGDGDDGAASLQ